MIILGIDPGFRACGWCLVGDSKVLSKGTVKNGSLKDWRPGIIRVINAVEDALQRRGAIDVVAVEEIVWYGKRKGSLALAHLAGALYGYFSNHAAVMFFLPRDVKALSATLKKPSWNEHELDALALCQLALKRADSKLANGKKTPG